MGYSTAGIVLECGNGVYEFKPGDRVAAVGPHAGIISVGRNLCARIPEGVSFEQAAYASVAAIGLQGLRLANLALGHRVLIIGMGLIGLMCVAMAKAHGCAVFATDVDPRKLEMARAFGADRTGIGTPTNDVFRFSDSHGVDAVIITAATDSNEPVEFAAEACRSKGRIVLVGVVGLNLPRAPFFNKELEFRVSCSLGPGRGDSQYEEKGTDYPIGHVRFTAQRNMQTVLELMAAGKLAVERLTTHRFPIDRAGEAYDLITSSREPHVGVVIQYPPNQELPIRPMMLAQACGGNGNLGVSMIGAGNFARLIMAPALKSIEGIAWRGICTARGLNAEDTGRKLGFEFATSDASDIWCDPATRAVFIATRHDLHANLVIAALQAGKHVFVEKPLCINAEQLEMIRACVADLGESCPLLMVGFNRRFTPAAQELRHFFEGVAPITIAYRFASGCIPRAHWTQDEEIGGGRIVGEGCHAIDTCVALAGSPPVRVFAESVSTAGAAETTDDKAFIVLRHRNGSVSNISYQSGGDGAFPPERIEMFGGGRTAVLDSWSELQFWQGNRCKRQKHRRDQGHETEFRAFLSACRSGGPWPISWEELDSVAWATLMAVRSLREGIPFTAERE